MAVDSLENRIQRIISERRQEIIVFAEDIFAHPELGFKEERTAERLAQSLERLGLLVRRGLAVTGVKGYLRGTRSPEYDGETTVAILGELDAVRSPLHPKADPTTKAAHTCGHHAQLAALFGAAMALSDPEVSSVLEGNVIFFAVPAEEYGEIEFKNSLREKGIIQFLGGKPELIRLGEFDEIDLVLSHHVHFSDEKHKVVVGSGSTNGFISKLIRYSGKEAHAAGAPYEGINALNAAVIGFSALNAQRETFKDSDTVRINSIITKGGDLVNVVPGEVKIEVLVRARTLEAILDANAKATRAFAAGASAIGAEVEIIDLPGYLPRIPEAPHSPVADVARQLVDSHQVRVTDPDEHQAFSTDTGDVSHLLPVLSFSTGGISGRAHAADFMVTDPEVAYILPAKIMALTVYSLLRNRAAQARQIRESFHPKLTKAEYIRYMNSLLGS
ncbi:MAG: amidohydrolase [Firmicutes bacterium]|nr:amidohydrolase [Bacillota bacterium]